MSPFNRYEFFENNLRSLVFFCTVTAANKLNVKDIP